MRAEPFLTAAELAITSWHVLVAEDLSLLARLHGLELDAETLAALKAAEFPTCLVLPPATRAGEEARLLLARTGDDPAFAMPLDDLAADYAAIYLTGRYHASPNESAWLDADGLERQAPMFAVREWYRKFDLAAGDWRRRQDDNLSLQLQFVAHLCRIASDDAGWRAVAEFLDAHLLRWLDHFAERVAGRAATPFYAALGMLTADYLHALRAALVLLADVPPPPADEEIRPGEAAPSAAAGGDCAAFVPGAGPTW
ncbi:MAG: molecular chaperone TorD family protein [Betaproteobacteria bacterium]|nr:molecular chaperone TorD family protein [Betaproteobacteria bacterium]MCL2886928.1 molecular chaperone TorD family protein [Betaproteobacteria bacterium]